MDLEDLKERWQQRGAPEPQWGKGEDMNELRTKLASLRRSARCRDLRETIAAVFVAAVFSWMAWTIDRPLARAGALVIAASAIFIIVWMRAAGGRNTEPDVGLSVLEFFRQELRYLDRQASLLRSVLWWYIGPNLIGLLLFFIGSGGSPVLTAALVGGALLLSAVIYWLNQLAARAAVMPLRDDVARVLRELEEGT